MLSALLIGVRNILRSGLGMADHECFIRIDNRVPAVAPDRFIVVMPYGWRVGDTREVTYGIDETYSIAVRVCARSRDLATDMLADELYLSRTMGLEVVARHVIGLIHQSHRPIEVANSLIATWTGSTDAPVIEPFRWSHCDPFPQPHDPDWMLSTDYSTTHEAAFSLGVYFTGARRLASRESLMRRMQL